MTNGTHTNGNLLKILIQGGLAGIAILALIMFYSVVSNHISHNTEVLIELKTSIDRTNSINEAQVESMKFQANAFEGLKDAILGLRLR